MSLRRKIYTLAATWTNPGNSKVDKTISSCVAGQPIFIVHGGVGWARMRVKSGAVHSKDCDYGFGNVDAGQNFIIVPNATSVVVTVWSADDDTYYVYKQ